MKFLHTADWQIGMKAAHVGKAGPKVREERLNAGRRVIEIAQQEKVQFMLIAGDTFEDNGVSRVLVQKTADILADFNAPVYIIPGNHDPFLPGSVWTHPVWESLSNVHLLLEEKPAEIPGGLLYPCPVFEKHSGKDPTAWIQASEAQCIKIGLAHGTVEGIPTDETDYPIPRNVPTRVKLDYTALGHWHSTATYEGEDEAVRMAYSGTHEPTQFGERDSGNALIVEIPSFGAKPLVTPMRTGALKWVTLDDELIHFGEVTQLRQQIESMDEPESTLLNIRIAGLLAVEEQEEIARIHEIAASRFLFNQIDTSRIRPAPEDENWVTQLPTGIIRDTGMRLRELSDPHFQGERPEDVPPEVAARALVELYALIHEVVS